jgi:hypothetical protein
VNEYIGNGILLDWRQKSIYSAISSSALIRAIKKRKRVSTDTYKKDNKDLEITRYFREEKLKLRLISRLLFELFIIRHFEERYFELLTSTLTRFSYSFTYCA